MPLAPSYAERFVPARFRGEREYPSAGVPYVVIGGEVGVDRGNASAAGKAAPIRAPI